MQLLQVPCSGSHCNVVSPHPAASPAVIITFFFCLTHRRHAEPCILLAAFIGLAYPDQHRCVRRGQILPWVDADANADVEADGDEDEDRVEKVLLPKQVSVGKCASRMD